MDPHADRHASAVNCVGAGIQLTRSRGGTGRWQMGHVTEAFTDNSTLLGSRVSAGSTFTHIRCIALNATASAGPALPLSAPYTMPAVGYNLFAGWGHAAFLDASDTWQLIQLPDTCTQLTEVAVTPIGGNNENDFEPRCVRDAPHSCVLAVEPATARDVVTWARVWGERRLEICTHCDSFSTVSAHTPRADSLRHAGQGDPIPLTANDHLPHLPPPPGMAQLLRGPLHHRRVGVRRLPA